MTTITEHDVEHTVLDRLADFGWQIAYGPDIAPDAPNAERTDYGQVMLEQWVRASLARLKPDRPGRQRAGQVDVVRLDHVTLRRREPSLAQNPCIGECRQTTVPPGSIDT